MAGEQGDIARTGPETWGSENHAMMKDTACRLLSPIEQMRGAYYDVTNKLTDKFGKSRLRMRPGGTFRAEKGASWVVSEVGVSPVKASQHGPHRHH